MILNFQNPTFYENIEKITIKPTYQGKEKHLQVTKMVQFGLFQFKMIL